MTDHKVVDREQWQAAREELLRREKEHTRMGDELARQRGELPWVAIEKEYRFDTDDGTRSLPELFDGRSQLLLYHFMFGPSYQAGCPVNSSIADGLNGMLPHLHAHDVTLLLVSRAPLAKLQAYRQRMGWNLPWVSAANTDFNFDFGASYTEEQVREFIAPVEGSLPPIVRQNATAAGTDVLGYLSESPAVNVFTLQDGAVYQTYATTARGVEFLMSYYPILDRVPKGRDEGDAFQTWIRRHDEYAPRGSDDYNTKIIEEFRANQGRVGGPWAGTTLILIHHIGARSGVERVTPLGCFPQGDGRFAIVASNGGSPTHPAWYHNLKANPRITVEVGTQTFTVLAEELHGTVRAELWPKLVAEAPQLGESQTRVTRQIPVFMLTRSASP